ncbi:Papain inhibitor [Tolypocladium paradoxum]|uniref:Papain inhibitor n=1 Tax=Tolypocladium paradoxum TaxID=94208 RepID=A0A2S4L1U3_9HYPO|nr:Papain inhibitor [Tolypocladium paradoxum]
MVAFTTTLTALAAVFAVGFAAPAQTNDLSSTNPLNIGEISWSKVGYGACDVTSKDTDFVVAVSTFYFNAADQCGREILVRHGVNSAVAKLVNCCSACKLNDIVLSPAAFEKAVGNLTMERVIGAWEFI